MGSYPCGKSEDDDEKMYVRERLRMKSATIVKCRFGTRIG